MRTLGQLWWDTEFLINCGRMMFIIHSFLNRFEQAKYAHTRSVLGVVWTHCDLPEASTFQWDLLFLRARSPRATTFTEEPHGNIS